MSNNLTIILKSLGFLIFLSLVVLINFMVFRNLYYYYLEKYNLYAFLSSLGFVFLVLLFFMLTHFYANIVTILMKRTFNNLLGIFFLFSFLFICLEIVRLLGFENKIFFYITLAVGTILVLYSVSNAYNIQVNNIEMVSNKVDKEYKIAVISDLHIGSNAISDLNKAIDLVNRQNPDILLIAGDFIDEDFVFKEDLGVLRTIKAKTYYTYGNHETYLKTHVEDELSSYKNVIFLRNKSIDFDDNLSIVGVDDNFGKLKEGLSKIKVDKNKYTLLLNHQPNQIDVANQNNIDFMISGHTHNGQIFPFNYLVKLQFKYIKGLYTYNQTNLYVLTGTGTWGPKMRLGSDNELLIITLKPEKN